MIFFYIEKERKKMQWTFILVSFLCFFFPSRKLKAYLLYLGHNTYKKNLSPQKNLRINKWSLSMVLQGTQEEDRHSVIMLLSRHLLEILQKKMHHYVFVLRKYFQANKIVTKTDYLSPGKVSSIPPLKKKIVE